MTNGVIPWLALTLVVHFSRSFPTVRGIVLLWLGWYAAMAIGHRGVLPLPAPVYYIVIAVMATGLTVPFVIDQFAARHLSGAVFSLVLPAAFVSVELLRERFAPTATWDSIAYTQQDNLALLQLASVGGVYIITFAVVWTASCIELAWRLRLATPLLICGGVIGIALMGGTLRLAWAPTDQRSVRAAAVNQPRDLFAPGEVTRFYEGRIARDDEAFRAKLSTLHDWFLAATVREARAGATIVAWPEAMLLVFADDEAAFVDRARHLAEEHQIHLSIGLASVSPGIAPPMENRLVVIDPTGRVIISYLKTHPVFGWEAGVIKKGDGVLPVVNTASARIAGAICYDADYPEFIRQAGMKSADLLLLPANDWRDVKESHAQMARVRAIENGVSLLRPAASGISIAVDPYGRELARVDSFAPGDASLVAQIPIAATVTIYSRIGDLFAWLCVIGTAAAIGMSIHASYR